MTSAPINPYESPLQIDKERPDADAQAGLLWRLRGPTMGLIILAGWQSFLLLVAVPSAALMLIHGDREEFWTQSFVFVASIASPFILFASIRMRQMRSLKLCRIAAIMACIPFVTPGFCLGIPFGIWATIVLFMPNTVAAFDQSPVLQAELVES
jgi:hypothetical protein